MTTAHHPDEPADAHRSDHLARATDENSGHAVAGDTPPAEGLGVGPTNPGMEADKSGEGGMGRILLGLLIALVVIGVLLFVIGRISSLG